MKIISVETLIVVMRLIVFLITQVERFQLRIVPMHLSCLCPNEMTFYVFHIVSRMIRHKYVAHRIHGIHVSLHIVSGAVRSVRCGLRRIARI